MTELTITTKYGPLTIKVDECDSHFLEDYHWFAHKAGHTFYARRGVKSKGIKRGYYLHRAIMNAADGLLVDHINGDGMDNRRSNLRVVTHAQNIRNMRKPVNNTSGFKGVYQKNDQKRNKRFEAYITLEGRRYSAGHYLTAIEAAHAYNIKAAELFGESARLNVI